MAKFVLINVLKKEFFDDCHIKGSIHVPRTELEKYAEKLSKDDEIVVYCAHAQCPESTKAWEILKNLGFNVRAFEGGMREWLQLGYPYEGQCQQDYLKEKHEPQPEEPGKTISAEEVKRKLQI